jgi:hypothetical protein
MIVRFRDRGGVGMSMSSFVQRLRRNVRVVVSVAQGALCGFAAARPRALEFNAFGVKNAAARPWVVGRNAFGVQNVPS